MSAAYVFCTFASHNLNINILTHILLSMKRHLLTSAALAFAAMTVSVPMSAAGFKLPQFTKEAQMPQLRKYTPNSFTPNSKITPAVTPMSASVEASKVLPGGDDITMLLAPDGSTWYAVVSHEMEKQNVSGGGYQTTLKGFDITVFDNEFNEIGKVRDTYELAEGEARVTDIQMDMTLTQKFFNSGLDYEVIVCVYCTTPDYALRTHTLAYTVSNLAEGEKSTRIFETDGMIVESDNFSTQSYSEDYLITIMDYVIPNPDDYTNYNDFMDAYKCKLSTYKKAGWSDEPNLVHEVAIPQTKLPGDGMSVPYFMLCKTADNKPALVVSHYEKTYFVDQMNDDYTPTADNKLLIDVYTMASLTASKANLVWSDSISMEVPAKGYLAKYYSIGNFSFSDDVKLPALQGAGKPEYILTVADYTNEDPDNAIYSFYRVNGEGKKLATFIEKTASFSVLSPAKGENPQATFVIEGDSGYEFHIVDTKTGKEVLNLPQIIEDEELSADFDRVKLGGKVYYVARLLNHEKIGDYVYERIAWITPEGKIDHVDQVNVGLYKDVDNAKVNIVANVLNPYVFDTDDDMEYMVLIKRNSGKGTTDSEEVLLIADTQGDPIFEFAPDNEVGVLASMGVSNEATNPTLVIISDNNGYIPHLFELPLTKFAGGEGTAQNPYLISTIADLQAIRSNTAASYKLIKNIDATGYDFIPVSNFSGSLDGNGYTISSIEISAATTVGIFESAANATIKNLTIVNPVVDLSSAKSTASAVLVADAYDCTIENVTISGAKITCEEYNNEFGVIAGTITNNTVVTDCNVTAADINLPEAENVGGIASSIKTGASVKVSAFSGKLIGGTSVGGILGDGHTSFVVEDCHVDADITAKHTVGGVVGYASARGLINRNVVEGSITTTAPRWKGNAMGGVLGLLTEVATTDHNENGPVVPEGTAKVVTNNIVALKSMSPVADDRYASAHRIVGYTSANFDEPYVDPGMESNYVVGALSAIQSGIETEGTSTEGATLATEELNRSFLESLGFVYGETATAPWSVNSVDVPYLYFEMPFVLDKTEVSLAVGESFTITAKVRGNAEIAVEDLGFICDWNEDLLEVIAMDYDNNVVTLSFTALAEGDADITIGMLGAQTKVKVSIDAVSAIGAVSTEASATITYDGYTVSCPAAQLAIYNLSGVQVAQGYENISVENLSSGVYAVVAVTANDKAVIKIAVK